MPNVEKRETSGSTTVRSAGVLTLSYNDGATTAFITQNAPYVEFEINFTVGASTGMQWVADQSDDGTTWSEVTEDDAGTDQTNQLQRTILTTSRRIVLLRATRAQMRLRVRAVANATGTSCDISARRIYAP